MPELNLEGPFRVLSSRWTNHGIIYIYINKLKVLCVRAFALCMFADRPAELTWRP